MKPGKMACFACGNDRARRKAALLCPTYCRFERGAEALRTIVHQPEKGRVHHTRASFHIRDRREAVFLTICDENELMPLHCFLMACMPYQIAEEYEMYRKVGTAAAAFVLLVGSITASFAETGGSLSAGENGVGGSPQQEGIGNTSSTHNPNPSHPSTGMENRSGTEMGSDTSTHNPGGKKD